MSEDRQNLRGENPHWNDVTVKTILRNEVYIGHTVQNKTGTVSYKNHKQISKPEQEWIKVENTHEPLISLETWETVQKMDNHPSRWRSGRTGTVAMFGGMLRCMDCGSAMRYMRDYRKKTSGKEPEFKAYVCNRYASGGKLACSSHYINQRVLVDIVLLDIQLKAMWAQNNPEGLKEKIRKQKNSANAEQLRSLQATLTAAEKRLTELEKLVQSVYEDKVKGTIPEAFCVQLMQKYENERVEAWLSPKRTPIVCAVSKDDAESFSKRGVTFVNGRMAFFVKDVYLLEDDYTNSYCYTAMIETKDGFLVEYYHSDNSPFCLNASKITKVYRTEIE